MLARRCAFVILVLCLSSVYGNKSIEYSRNLDIAKPCVGKNQTDCQDDFQKVLNANLQGDSTETAETREGRRLGDDTPLDPSYALCFVLDMLMVGALALQLTFVPGFKSMQFTVLVFVLGVLYAIMHESSPFIQEFRGRSFHSYRMWMNIPSQVLMWVFMPPLVMCDAMTTDIAQAGRVYKQVIWLAGPFVLMNTALLAPCLYLVVGWEPVLCITGAAMWGSTDPVAVVALLKQLGAHPLLTSFIQGESLLNDGAAIITFTMAAGVLRGDLEIGVPSIVLELVLKCLSSTALGLMVGFVFRRWIKAASYRYIDACDMIQVSLTIVSAFLSWFLAEGIFSGSGVISTVATGFVLADSMWPSIVRKDVLKVIWRVIEYMFNAMVFFLAGALTGRAFYSCHLGDFSCFWKLPVLWVFLVLVRLVCLILSWPLLSWLSDGIWTITWREIIVMSWGGLRGAVALCLAIQLLPRKDQVNPVPTEKEANNAIFYTGGLACMTMVVNAQLSPILLKSLGLTDMTEVQFWTLQRLTDHLKAVCNAGMSQLKTDNDKNCASRVVSRALAQTESAWRSDAMVDDDDEFTDCRAMLDRIGGLEGTDVIRGLADAQQHWQEQAKYPLKVADVISADFLQRIELCTNSIQTSMFDEAIAARVNNGFLTLLKTQYWKMIYDGEFAKDRRQSRVLLNGVALAMNSVDGGLEDLQYIFSRLRIEEKRDDGLPLMTYPQFSQSKFIRRPLDYKYSVVDTLWFSTFSVLLPAAHSLYWIWEPRVEDSQSSKMTWWWLLIQGSVCSLLFAEVVARYVACIQNKRGFFNGFLNLYDVLVFSSFFFEFGLEFVAVLSKGFASNRISLRIINRTLNVCRLYRVASLVKAIIRKCRIDGNVKTRDVLEDQLTCIVVLTAFVRAHVASQERMLSFFGTKNGSEVAYCVLQSQAMVYRALTAIMQQAAEVDESVLDSLRELEAARVIVLRLTDAIEDAFDKEIIDKKEAFLLSAPLEAERERLDKVVGSLHRGVVQGRDGAEMMKLQTETHERGQV